MSTHSHIFGEPVAETFFARSPERVARDLLGCVLVSERDDGVAGGVIVETEAYLGNDDPGSHAATKGITTRNRVMYGPPGTVYVYFTYGMHHMLNLVCCPEGEAGAVLLRALAPTHGIDVMRARRRHVSDRDLCRGPGRLARALAVDLGDNGMALGSRGLWVYHGERVASDRVGVSGRIGLSAGHEKDLRFFVNDSPFVSRGRTGPAPARRRKREEHADEAR